MAYTKTVSANASYYPTNGSTTDTLTPVMEPIVYNGVLVPPQQIFVPGVFTAGTATIPSASASTSSSNG